LVHCIACVVTGSQAAACHLFLCNSLYDELALGASQSGRHLQNGRGWGGGGWLSVWPNHHPDAHTGTRRGGGAEAPVTRESERCLSERVPLGVSPRPSGCDSWRLLEREAPQPGQTGGPRGVLARPGPAPRGAWSRLPASGHPCWIDVFFSACRFPRLLPLVGNAISLQPPHRPLGAQNRQLLHGKQYLYIERNTMYTNASLNPYMHFRASKNDLST